MRITSGVKNSTSSYDFARSLGPTASGVMRTTKVVPSYSRSANGTKAFSIK